MNSTKGCQAKTVWFWTVDRAGERKVLAYSSYQLRKIQSRRGGKHDLVRLRRPVRRIQRTVSCQSGKEAGKANEEHGSRLQMQNCHAGKNETHLTLLDL